MKRRFELGIKAWLVLLSVFSVVPIASFSAFTIYRLGNSQQQAQTADLARRAEAVAAAVEQRLDAMLAATTALAESESALRNDPRALYDHARRLLTVMPDVAAVVLIDRDGRQAFNTALPYGAAPPASSLPEVVERVFTIGQPTLSDVYVGAVVKKPSVSVNVPVLVDGHIVYVLRMMALSEAFNRLLSRQEIPGTWTTALLSQSGTIVARNRKPEQFVGTKTAPGVTAALAEDSHAIFQSQTSEGTAVKAAVVRIPAWDWAVVMGVPEAQLTAGINHSLAAMGIAGALLLLLGLVGSFWLSRRLARQVTNVWTASAAPAAGGLPVRALTRIREFNELGAALGSAKSREHQVSSQLSASQATEARLAQLVSELRRSEERFRLLFNNCNDAIVLHEINPMTGAPVGTFTEVNDIACLRLGYSREELQGMTPADLNGGAPPLLKDYLDIATRGHAVFERLHVAKDGRRIPVEINTRRFTLEGRTMVLAIIRDITERKRSAELLAKEASRLQALLRTASDGIHVLDLDGRLCEASDSFLRMLGYSADEAIGLTVGDWDLLHTPDELRQLLRGVSDSIKVVETRYRRRDGRIIDVEIACRAVTLDGQAYVFNSARDVTDRKAAEAEIQNLAFYDTLTQLPNRRLLLDRLTQAKATSERSRCHAALLFIDLDNFKTLNDTLGHKIGDQPLAEVAKRLTSCVRSADTVARLGGDEFVVMIEDLSDTLSEAAAQAEGVADKILHQLVRPFRLGEQEHHSAASLGVTLFRGGEVSNDELLKQADLAMYQAKAGGRNTKRFFDPQMQAALAARSTLEAELRAAVTDHQFFLHYQPQIDERGRIVGAEGLVRWLHPRRGIVSPGDFIGLAEDTGLILPIGYQVLTIACRQLVAWSQVPATAHLTVAVNVSARQFRHSVFVDEVRRVVSNTGADPTRLKLELTESLLLQDLDDSIGKMMALRAMGVSFALDDFGTGYSSLAYLKLLPLSEIKIDRSFVRDVLTDANDATIARTIIVLGKSLGLKVIAEGVETPAQWTFLTRSGCDGAQGYLFGRPMPAAELPLQIEAGIAG